MEDERQFHKKKNYIIVRLNTVSVSVVYTGGPGWAGKDALLTLTLESLFPKTPGTKRNSRYSKHCTALYFHSYS